MSPLIVRLLSPSFAIDLAGVRIIDGDYDASDLAAVLGQPRVHEAALGLYRLAPHPALAYTCGPGSARALAAHLRLGNIQASHVDDGAAIDDIRKSVGELQAGRLSVLVSCERLAGRNPIPGISAAMLLRPTLSLEQHNRFLGRMEPRGGEVTVYDVVGNCRFHGLPEGWAAREIVGPSCEVIRDPHIDSLAGMPHRAAMAWAGRNIERLVLVQRAKGFKPGWVYNAVKSFDPAAADRWWAARNRASEGGG